jgi:hypothetical protein
MFLHTVTWLNDTIQRNKKPVKLFLRKNVYKILFGIAYMNDNNVSAAETALCLIKPYGKSLEPLSPRR